METYHKIFNSQSRNLCQSNCLRPVATSDAPQRGPPLLQTDLPLANAHRCALPEWQYLCLRICIYFENRVSGTGRFFAMRRGKTLDNLGEQKSLSANQPKVKLPAPVMRPEMKRPRCSEDCGQITAIANLPRISFGFFDEVVCGAA